MGHETAVIRISAERADELRKDSASRGVEVKPPQNYWSYGSKSTFESRMVTEALHCWEPERRSASERAGDGILTDPVPAACVDQFLSSRHADVVGHSLVVPVARDQDVVVRKVKEAYPADAATISGFHQNPTTPLSMALWTAIRERHGHAAVGARIVKAPALRKPAAKGTEGKTKTVYDVVTDGYSPRTVGTGDTLAEARQKAVTFMEANPQTTALSVVGRVVRVTEDGAENASLLTVIRPVSEGATVTVEVELHTAKANAKPAHWLVAFDFHV